MTKKEKTYIVRGKFKGKAIDKEIRAYTMKQAKYFAMNDMGFYGRQNWLDFQKTRSVKVRLKR